MFRKFVAAGVSKINITKVIKIANCEGMAEYTAAHAEENNTFRLDHFATDRVKACVKEHIRIFESEQKA